MSGASLEGLPTGNGLSQRRDRDERNLEEDRTLRRSQESVLMGPEGESPRAPRLDCTGFLEDGSKALPSQRPKIIPGGGRTVQESHQWFGGMSPPRASEDRLFGVQGPGLFFEILSPG